MNTPSSVPALQGALLAFQGAQSPNPSTDGRLTPGTSRAPSRDPSPRQLAAHGTRTSGGRPDVSSSRSDASGDGPGVVRRLSPSRTADSLVAANLAAARSPGLPVSPVRTGRVDGETGSIRRTAALISKFEGTEDAKPANGERGGPGRARTPTGRAGGGGSDDDPVKNRSQSVPRPMAKTPAGTSCKEPVMKPRTPSQKPQLQPKPRLDAALSAARQVVATQPSGTKEASPASQPVTAARPPTPPKPRGSRMRTASPAPSASTVVTSSLSAEPETALPRHKTTSPEDTSVSASSAQFPPRRPSRASHAPLKSPSTSPVRPPVPPPRRTPAGTQSTAALSQTTALSNAILAGSLASSRLTPSNTGDMPAKSQPSPRLLPTLRTGDGKRHEHDEEKRHRHRLRHRHGHKKGKRRDERISEKQRRRYEALWASNKGLLVDEHLASGAAAEGGDKANYVVNVVVRELWRRSRLPDDELEEVWALVDVEGRGMLGRREFVVGTWLVDQRLKGRKIPSRVGEGVWDSANGVVVRR
ncbi:hypothetical protein VUR80DRAFT_9784 [Thermomyces stellatus]